MQALILAAGSGSRLEAVSEGQPKGLIEVGGIGLLERQIAMLNAASIHRICLVTGYEYARVEERLKQRVEYRYNPFYSQSNNLVSLLFARDWIDDDVLVLYADLLYGPDMLELALTAPGDIGLLVDKTAVEAGHALVSIDAGRVRGIGRELSLESADARFIGIARLSRRGIDAFLPELDAAAKAGLLDQYYTIAIAALVERNYPVQAIEVAGRAWREIDSPDDLRMARQAWG